MPEPPPIDLNLAHGAAAAERIGSQASAAAERLGRQSDAAAAFLTLVDRLFLKVYTETDPVQAAAIKDIQRGASPQPSQGLPP